MKFCIKNWPLVAFVTLEFVFHKPKAWKVLYSKNGLKFLTFEYLSHYESWRTISTYFNFGLKNSSFWLPCKRPSSSADCTRELFKGLSGSASPVDCTRKKFFWLWVRTFCEWRHKWSSFGVILTHVTWPRAQPLGQSVSLKFSLETRLESESFEPLIDFLALLVHKLWSKINKLINYLIR